MFLCIGLYCFYSAIISVDTRSEVIGYLVLGITIISIDVINYIFYLKRALQDYNMEIREHNNKITLRIGEVLEFICFILCILCPIFRIPKFIELFEHKKEMIFEIIKTFLISISGALLLFTLNPLDIKGKLNIKGNKKKKRKKKKSKNQKKKSKGKKIMSEENSKEEKVVKKENKTKKKKKTKAELKKEQERNKKIKSIATKVVLVLVVILLMFRMFSFIVLIKISKELDKIDKLEQSTYTEKFIFKELGIKRETTTKRIRNNDNYYEISNYKVDLEDENIQDSTNEFWVKNNSESPYQNKFIAKDNTLYKIFSPTFEDGYYTEVPTNNFPNYLKEVESHKLYKNTLALIKDAFFYPSICISKYNNKICYIMEKNSMKFYFDYKTYKPIAILEKGSDDIKFEYDFSSDMEEIKEPDETKYKNIEFGELISMENISTSSTPVNGISGTELLPGESLIENVELGENETLNFLGLTGNTFGIAKLSINSKETYDYMRKSYSNLIELTDEDFYYYHVVIAYKEGYKLNYTGKITSSENSLDCNSQYLLSEEPSEKNSLLLFVLPRIELEDPVFVINNQSKFLSILVAEQAANDNQETIRNALKIPGSGLFLGKNYIEKLDRETILTELDYILRDPEEVVVWVMEYTYSATPSYTAGIKVYINAQNGDLIGAKRNY